MEKLKAELARKKAEAEALKQKAAALSGGNSSNNNVSSSSSSSSSAPTKFIRQKDVLEAKQQELEEAQRKADEERLARKRQLEQQERQQQQAQQHKMMKIEKVKEQEKVSSGSEETSKESKEGEDNQEVNPAGKAEATVTATAEEEAVVASSSSSSSSSLVTTDLYDPKKKFTEIPGLSEPVIVQSFFQTLLNQWKYDLLQRPEYEAKSAKGKNETKNYEFCYEHILPLFRLCQSNTVPVDILHRVHLMVKYCEEGNFVKANDEYIKTAIGNAAWPIGLTMVGIHERTGRERISTAKIAHVMNNEMERKYLTSVKRLITFCQTKRPDVPPSMKVLT